MYGKIEGNRRARMSEHRHHPTKYKISVSHYGSSRPLRTWGPYESRQAAIEALDEKREEARRTGRLAPPYGKAGGDLVFHLLHPTEAWGTAGPLRRDLSRTARRDTRKTSAVHDAKASRKFRKKSSKWMRRSSRDPSATRAADRPWRVRDRLTRQRYYFDTHREAVAFVDSVSTSEITGEPLARWRDRLLVEKNR